MNRRGFLGGLIGALAAPTIVRTPGLLMPVRKRAELPPIFARGDLFVSGIVIKEVPSLIPHVWDDAFFAEYVRYGGGGRIRTVSRAELLKSFPSA